MNKKKDRVLKDGEAQDLYQMELDKLEKEIEKAKAFQEYFMRLKAILSSNKARTMRDLPSQQQEKLLKEHDALVEKYGPSTQ